MSYIVEIMMQSKFLLQNWSIQMPSYVITPFVSLEKKINLPLRIQKRPKIVLLRIGLTNKFGFKTSSFPCKSQLR